MFKSIYIFTVLILIHEMGHSITGVLLGFNLKKIYLYPYGGCSKFDINQNVSIIKELLVLVMGPIIQVVFYLLIRNYVGYNDYILFKRYNYLILLFNLLPIYPLDGGRLFCLIISVFIPYKKSLKISIVISCFTCIIFLFYNTSYALIVAVSLIVINIIREWNNIDFYYYRFLFERLIYKYNFRRIKIIDNINNMYRDRLHLIKENNRYYKEKDYLKTKYTNKM